jgi:hypothetical protein
MVEFGKGLCFIEEYKLMIRSKIDVFLRILADFLHCDNNKKLIDFWDYQFRVH